MWKPIPMRHDTKKQKRYLVFNFSSSAIKALDSLLERLESETIEPIEKSIKDAKKNFKAGNYLAISSLLLLTGLAIVLSQLFTGQFFIQALIYFSMALLCILIFALISWRILR